MTLRTESIVSNMRRELTSLHAERQRLVDAVGKLDDEAQRLERAIAVLEGDESTSTSSTTRTVARISANRNANLEKQQLREQIEQILQAHPDGLSSIELFDLIRADWPGLSVVRVSLICTHAKSLTGTANNWYYVPPETEENEERDETA